MTRPTGEPAAGPPIVFRLRTARTILRDRLRADRRTGGIRRTIWLAAGSLDALLALRLALRLSEDAQQGGLAQMVLWSTRPLVLPFVDAVPSAPAAGPVFEPASVLAAVAYSLAGLGLALAVRLVYRRGHELAQGRLHRLSLARLHG